MRNTIHLAVIVTFIVLATVAVVGRSHYVPNPERVHFGRMTYPRRWGRWCSEDIECGLGYCRAYMCQCYRGYISWYFTEICTYEQRSKLTAFLVSFFVGIFGIDWFVLSRGNIGFIIAGLIKMFIGLGCCAGWPFALIDRSTKSRNRVLVSNVVAVILTITSVVWWLTDWIRILADVAPDGHGAPLRPWGYDYEDRIPFRV